ncbi:MAG: helix-turn-helix domain-containing protein [Firmicutes bacterium]|nr:helix-turn-helix domain-containing protein [Bacillota bacterium]
MEQGLMDLKQFAAYSGMGMTKIRELITAPECAFSLKIGGKWYISIQDFDDYVQEQIIKSHEKCAKRGGKRWLKVL